MSAPYDVRGRVAVVTLDNPPVNGLGHATRERLMEALQRARDDAAVEAVVIAGAGALFSGGADIREFGTPRAVAEPHLLTLIEAVEASPKPVVAALHGTCMGGGLELALGCHYRVARRGTRLALPEVKLGLLPGAGGTQRLPRAVGLETALAMIVSGEPWTSERLADVPGQALVDRLVDGDVVDAAVAFAREVAAVRPLPRVGARGVDAPDADALLHAARRRAGTVVPRLPAPVACIDALEAAVRLPLAQGLQRERELFMALMATPESRALRHAFLAERAASKVPGVPADTPRREIRRVAVVGAGTMGTGIAVACLDAGLPVTLVDAAPEALARGVATVRGLYDARVHKGRLGAHARDARLARLAPTVDLAAVRTADLVIEAVFEDMAVKSEVFRRLDAVARPGAILATNTSTLDVDRLADATGRPADVLGMHFFSPAHVMRLLEVVRGARTAPDVLATVLALARTLGKTAVVAGVCDGFIGNRLLEPYLRQAGFLLDEGASPAQVDHAIEAFGFAMGPFRMSDLAGNDIGWAIRRRRALERPGLRDPASADRLCEAGRFGQKTGAGWYDYAPGRRDAQPSPVVDALLARHRAALGLAPRAIGDEEIVQRLVLALVNEGARVLEEGIALRASDIDLVYLAGYGFPRHRGGPMHWAESLGLDTVVATMARFARDPHADPASWTPAPRLARCAAEGRRFDD